MNSTMKHLSALALALALLAAPAASSQAEGELKVADPKAADALVMFTKACLLTRGLPNRIAAKMKEFDGVKLPDRMAVEVAHGKLGSSVWKYDPSLHGAALLVAAIPPARCEVMVRKVEARSLQDGIVQVLRELAQGGEMRFHLETHSTQPTEGGSEETSNYLMKMIRDQDASVSITTTASPSTDIQGILVYEPH